MIKNAGTFFNVQKMENSRIVSEMGVVHSRMTIMPMMWQTMLWAGLITDNKCPCQARHRTVKEEFLSFSCLLRNIDYFYRKG